MNNSDQARPLDEPDAIESLLDEGTREVAAARRSEDLADEVARALTAFKAGELTREEGIQRFGDAFSRLLTTLDEDQQ